MIRRCKKCKKELQKRIRKNSTGYCQLCRLKLLPPALGKRKPNVMSSSSRYD